jgi:hypothetical protein
MTIEQVKNINEVFWVRPLSTAPVGVKLNTVYTVNRKNIKLNFEKQTIVFLNELNRWYHAEYFRVDPLIYN